MNCDVLILAGLMNSGPNHWQSHWERKHPEWKRVRHRDWTNPHCQEWVAELDEAIAECQGAPLLVAHSLTGSSANTTTLPLPFGTTCR